MSLIGKAAYLEICPCGTHGKIVLSTSKTGKELCSRQGIYEELERLRDEGELTEEEITFLKSQIPSDWPRLSEYVDFRTFLLCDTLSHLRELDQSTEEDEIDPVM